MSEKFLEYLRENGAEVFYHFSAKKDVHIYIVRVENFQKEVFYSGALIAQMVDGKFAEALIERELKKVVEELKAAKEACRA